MYVKITVLCALLVAGPGLAVGYANTAPDEPEVLWRGLTPEVELPAAPAPTRVTVPTVVVKAKPVPKRVARRAPKTCKTRDLDLYGGQVRVCARPATKTPAREAADLASLYR